MHWVLVRELIYWCL